jgi:hypothetical protein
MFARGFSGDNDGARRITPRSNAKYKAQLAEAAQFYGEVLSGKRGIWQLQEALSTDDFPILFGDITDRQMLAAYRQWPPSWQSIAARRELPNFKPTKLFKPVYGAQARLERVGELTEYPEAPVFEQTTQLLNVVKYGRRMAISWETLINDDLDQLRDWPDRLATGARRTEDYGIGELFIGSAGPSGTLYTVGNKNQIITANGASANNPPLTIAGLQDGFTVMHTFKDENGEPIMVDWVELVVPPALEIVARNILNATQLEINAAMGGGSLVGLANSSGQEQRLITANWMRDRVRLNVNPYIPQIATTNKNTSWFLFASPTSNRPALNALFLRGRTEPETFIKEPNARRIGGGGVDPMDGDFDLDAITYKVRHVFGAAVIDPIGTVASNGTGS